MYLLSIIIVNWNSVEFVRKCLQAVIKYRTFDCQIIVVDGASYDGCAEMIQRDFPEVDFIQSPENIGFGRCNNLGASQATGEYLLFLNPDTEVTPGAIECLLETAGSDSNIGLIGARLLNSDGTLQTSCVQALPTPLNQMFDSDLLRWLFPRSGLWGNGVAFASVSGCSVEAVSGACMLVSNEIFSRVGGFCSKYFMYAEDMHLCWDVAKLGRTVVYQPLSVVKHHGGGASAGEFSNFACIEMRRSLHYFISCRQGEVAGVAYRIGICVSAAIRLTILVFLSIFASGPGSSQNRISTHRWRMNLMWAIWPLGLEKKSY